MRISRGDTLVAVCDCADTGIVRGTAYLIDSAGADHMDLVDSAGNWLPDVPVGHPALALRMAIPGAPTAHVLFQYRPLGGVSAQIVIDLPGYSAASTTAALQALSVHLPSVASALSRQGVTNDA